MEILDTQIISYAYKGTYSSEVSLQSIASITAKEFLLVQGSGLTKVNYYVPLPKKFLRYSIDGRNLFNMDHPFSKKYTDQILIDLGPLHSPIIEFGNLAIAQIINMKERKLFSESIKFLEKEKRKIILDRFDFLIDKEIHCIPLNRNTVDLGLNLFIEFLKSYNTKENIRNTLNDIFILATAITTSATIITEDSLLRRFASGIFEAKLMEKDGSLFIDFGNVQKGTKQANLESKGYINYGWRVRVRNYKGW